MVLFGKMAIWSMTLPTFGGDFSRSNGINELGLVVGDSLTYNDEELHAYVWDNGNMIDLGVIMKDVSSASDINDSGLIVGRSTIDEIGFIHAAIWYYDSETGNVNGPIDIDVPESVKSDAVAVNELGQVVGLWEYWWDNAEAYIWDEVNGLRSIHTLPSWRESEAWDINNFSIVVGDVFTNWNAHAFVWDGQSMTLLDNIIPTNSRWSKIESAMGINDLNQIVGDGQQGGGQGDVIPYIMTPVNSTMQLSDAVPGIAGQVNSIETSGVTPGTRVYFTYSRFGGGALIPGCDVSVNALQIENPKLAGSAVADGDGVAKLTGIVPSGISGRELLFQAVVVGRCEISNLVVQRFE